jgi:hypothetical protein
LKFLSKNNEELRYKQKVLKFQENKSQEKKECKWKSLAMFSDSPRKKCLLFLENDEKPILNVAMFHLKLARYL